MRFLFVVNQLPFPPRNGVTVPLAAYVRGLAEREHTVKVLVLDSGGDGTAGGSEPETLRWASSVVRVPVGGRSSVGRVVGELLGRRPGFSVQAPGGPPGDLRGREFDVVWASPRAVVWQALEWAEVGAFGSPLVVAGVNDLWSKVLASRAGSGLLARLRGRLLAPVEAALLSRADLVLVQTETERRWARRIGDERLERAVLVLPNGVNDRLFELPLEFRGPRALFVGSLHGEYGKVVRRIAQELWPAVRARVPEARLRVVGRGAGPGTERALDRPGVEHHEFVESLPALYREAEVLLAPVGKGYGLINKVIEAMAAGVLVVGDETAFHGIPGFEAGRHGRVAADSEEMVSETVRALTEPDQGLEMKSEARALVSRRFRWQDRIEELLTAIRERRDHAR